MSIDAESRSAPFEPEQPEPESTEPPPWRTLLIKGAVIGVVLLFVALTRPEVITGSFGTAESTLRVLGLLAAFAGIAFLVRRYVTNVWVGRAVVWGLGAALILVAVVPAYQDEEVDQDLATSAADLGLDTSSSAAEDEASAVDVPAETPPTTAAAEPAEETPAAPVKLTTGQLSGLAGHRGSGEAAVYELDDGTRFVRLENFDVSNGPGIELWVVPTAGAESPDGGIKLGDVPGNNGSFNAPIPVDFDSSGDVTVLLWCAPVATPMAHATQAAA